MRWILFVSLIVLACLTVAPLHAEKAASLSHLADYDGVKVHYETRGVGDSALIFVHGWTCNSTFWKRSIGAFPEYHVLAIDLPGHGQSDKPHVEYTRDYFADSIVAVMQDAGVEKAVLVGHSMGVGVIDRFYRLHPQKTLGLVMIDGSPRRAKPEEIETFAAPLRANYSENFPKMLDNGMLRPIQDNILNEEIRLAMLATPEYVGLNVVKDVNKVTLKGKVFKDEIDVPVLVILAQSTSWKSDTEAFFRSIAPTLEFRVWRDVSHFLMMEKPAAFNESVRLFVSSHHLL